MCRIHRDLLPALQKWRAEDEARGITWVVNYHGEPVRDIRKAWEKVAGPNNKDTPHVLRHSAATWLVSSGKVPLPEISQYLGMSIDTLQAVYWHRLPEFQKNAASAGPTIGPMKPQNRE